MTRKLTDTLEEFMPGLEQEVITNPENGKDSSEETNNVELLQALEDFSLDSSTDDEDEGQVLFDTLNFDIGYGLTDVPVSIFPMSPFAFQGSNDKAILLSPTGDKQFIAARPSNREVYNILFSLLTDLNCEFHGRENTAELHRGLVEYTIYKLHQEGVTVYMTPELIEDLQPMEQVDFDYYVKAEMIRSSKGKGGSLINLLSPLLRSNVGGVWFSLTGKEEDDKENKRIEHIISGLDQKYVSIIRSANRLKEGVQYTLVIVPDDYRETTLSEYLKKRKIADCTVVTAAKAEGKLSSGRFSRVIILGLMEDEIIDMLGDPDVANLIRKVEITYGIAYGGDVVQAPEPVFYELQELIGPIRLVI